MKKRTRRTLDDILVLQNKVKKLFAANFTQAEIAKLLNIPRQLVAYYQERN